MSVYENTSFAADIFINGHVANGRHYYTVTFA